MTLEPDRTVVTGPRRARSGWLRLPGVAVVAGLTVAAACSGDGPTSPTPDPPGVGGNPSFEDQVLTLVNRHRSAGASCDGVAQPAVLPLVMDAGLRLVARRHSADMAANNYLSHTGLDNRTPDQRIRDAGQVALRTGENVAAGLPTPRDVVERWMESAGHCANIMSGGFDATGVGYASAPASDYHDYWTQVFTGG